MKARYIRVSTGNQSTLRQLVKQHQDEKVYIDIISGSIPFNQRPQAKELLNDIDSGVISIVSVSSVDRLGRNAFDVQHTIELFNQRTITLNVDNLGISSIVNGKPNSIFKMICDVLSNVAQMERESLLERQREGIAAARAVSPDKYKGRLTGSIDSDEVILDRYKNVVKVIKQHPNLSLRKIGSITNVAANTVKKVKFVLDNK
jgi:DNA invertase Pin-like site-specific DNA recombinase